MLPSTIGSIVSWVGSIATIPSGWQLCDGTNGTPDLRNKFVVGSGDTYAPGQVGGFLSHIHNFNLALHAHNIGAGSGVQFGFDFVNATASQIAVAEADSQSNLAPFHSLAYIMQVGAD